MTENLSVATPISLASTVKVSAKTVQEARRSTLDNYHIDARLEGSTLFEVSPNSVVTSMGTSNLLVIITA